tara:strand:- start:157 stop:420 length:264 start_codon:yes stop_codon:yes gene_type:complete
MTSCGAKGGRGMVAALEAGISERGLNWRVEKVHCMGKCHLGPTMRLLPDGPYIMGVKESDLTCVLDMLEENAVDALASAFPLPDDNA